MTANFFGELPGAPSAVDSGRRCRVCGSVIDADDAVGLSEGVCRLGRESVDLTGRPLAVRAAAALGERASRSIAALRGAA
jgi:hypothetical protein